MLCGLAERVIVWELAMFWWVRVPVRALPASRMLFFLLWSLLVMPYPSSLIPLVTKRWFFSNEIVLSPLVIFLAIYIKRYWITKNVYTTEQFGSSTYIYASPKYHNNLLIEGFWRLTKGIAFPLIIVSINFWITTQLCKKLTCM